MQSAIKAAIQYIEASRQAETQAQTMVTITQHRVDNLKLMLGRMPHDLTDMTNAISTLGATTAFTSEQRTSLVQSIHAKMQDEDAHAQEGGVVAKGQSHKFVEHYLTAKVYDKLEDKSITEEVRVQCLINFLHNQNGCKYPDVATRKRCVAILMLANDVTPTPNGAKACFDLFAKINVQLRGIRNHIPCTMRHFPEDPKDFTMLHPGLYDAEDPPTPSRFSRARIDEVCTIVSARNSNKLLASASSVRTSSCVLPANKNIDDPMRHMMELSGNPLMRGMMQLFAHMSNGGQPHDKAPDITIDYRPRSPTQRGTSSASLGGQPQSTLLSPPAPLGDEPMSQLSPPGQAVAEGGMPPRLRQALADGGGEAAASKNGKVGGPSIEDDIDDMLNGSKKPTTKKDVMIDAAKKPPQKENCGKRKGDGKDVDDRANKRAKTTKDYGTNLKTPPKFAGLVLPCLFNKCKIYGTDKKFRVYPRPNESKYDKTFAFTAKTKAQAWEKVIEYCKKPEIPRSSSNFIK